MNQIPRSKPLDIPAPLEHRSQYEIADDIYRINKFNKKMNAFTVDEKIEVDQNGKKYVNLTLNTRK